MRKMVNVGYSAGTIRLEFAKENEALRTNVRKAPHAATAEAYFAPRPLMSPTTTS